MEVVAHEVSEASGMDVDELLDRIPVLTQDHLAAGVHWPSENFTETIVGVHNSLLTQDWVEIHVPELNVDGTVSNDMTGVMRSHAINVATKEIQSFEGFYDADDWLSENLGYISTRDIT